MIYPPNQSTAPKAASSPVNSSTNANVVSTSILRYQDDVCHIYQHTSLSDVARKMSSSREVAAAEIANADSAERIRQIESSRSPIPPAQLRAHCGSHTQYCWDMPLSNRHHLYSSRDVIMQKYQ